MEPGHEDCCSQWQCEHVTDVKHPVYDAVIIHLDWVAEETDGRQPGDEQRQTDRQNGHVATCHQIVVNTGMPTTFNAVIDADSRRSGDCQTKHDIVGPVEPHSVLRRRRHFVTVHRLASRYAV